MRVSRGASPLPRQRAEHARPGQGDQGRGEDHLRDEALAEGQHLGELAALLLGAEQRQGPQLHVAHLLEREGLLQLVEAVAVQAFVQLVPDALPVGVDGAVREQHLVGPKGLLGGDQAHPVEPVLGAQVDLQLVAPAHRVVRLDGEPRVEEPVRRYGPHQVADGPGLEVDEPLRVEDHVLAGGDHLQLGHPGALAAKVAHRPPFGLGQGAPGRLRDRDLPARHRQAVVLHRAPVVRRQGRVLLGRDLAAPVPVRAEGLQADELHDLAGHPRGQGPLRLDVEDEVALVLVGQDHLAGAEVLEVVDAAADPVGEAHPELEERVPLALGGEAHHHLLGDHGAPEVDLDEPVLRVVGRVRLPPGERVPVVHQGARLLAAADGVDAARDRVGSGEDGRVLVGVESGVAPPLQPPGGHGAVRPQVQGALGQLPRRPVSGPVDDDLRRPQPIPLLGGCGGAQEHESGPEPAGRAGSDHQ